MLVVDLRQAAFLKKIGLGQQKKRTKTESC